MPTGGQFGACGPHLTQLRWGPFLSRYAGEGKSVSQRFDASRLCPGFSAFSGLRKAAPKAGAVISKMSPSASSHCPQWRASPCEIMDVQVARPPEAVVLEMMVFEVGDGVAHVGLARQEGLLPDHLAATDDAAHALDESGIFPVTISGPMEECRSFEWAR